MNNTDLTLVEHLSELRKRVIFLIVIFIILLPVAFFFSRTVCDYVYSSLTERGYEIFLFSITDGLVIRLSVSLIISVVTELPLIIFELGIFIFPGLKRKEKIISVFIACSVTICFFTGAIVFICCFAPLIIVLWKQNYSSMLTVISAKKYFDDWILCTCFFGLLFCVPVFILGVILIIHKRKYS